MSTGRPIVSHCRQSGIAVITALLVVALATMLVAGALADFQLDVRRTEAALFSEQAQLFALGAEAWATRILAEDAEDNDVDHPGEVWATDIPPLPIEGGTVDGFITDLQGRFNINNLITSDGATDPAAVAQFQRLLELLDLDQRWAAMAADWIDTDIDPNFPEGAEDVLYLGQTPAYRAANMPVTSATELMALVEMDQETFDILRPYIVALPPGTQLNVNTILPPVLAALSPELSLNDAIRIVEDRPEDGYRATSEVTDQLPAGFDAPLTVQSRYFRVLIRVNIGTVELTMYSLLQRQAADAIRPLLRSYGTD